METILRNGEESFLHTTTVLVRAPELQPQCSHARGRKQSHHLAAACTRTATSSPVPVDVSSVDVDVGAGLTSKPQATQGRAAHSKVAETLKKKRKFRGPQSRAFRHHSFFIYIPAASLNLAKVLDKSLFILGTGHPISMGVWRSIKKNGLLGSSELLPNRGAQFS